MTLSPTVPLRNEIPVQHTWDAYSIFTTDDMWEEALEAAGQQLARLGQFQGKLSNGPATLADWFERYAELQQKVGRLLTYAALFHHADTTDQGAAAKYNRVISLWGQAAAATAFAEPELLTIGEETLRRWLRDEARLAPYEHYVDELLRRAEHIRSPEVEALLGAVQDPFFTASSTAGFLVDADLTFADAQSREGEAVPVAQGSIEALLASEDRTLRRTAWESYADGHLAFQNTLANALGTAVKQNVFLARARRYPSALEAALSRNHIPPEVFHNLIATFQKHLPTWHRYWRVRRKALGVETLHGYDVKAPLTRRAPTVPYEQAVEWICEGMAPLGKEYVETMRRGCLEERWVDIYPNKGKRAGAFSAGVKGTHPFILMSYTDDLDSLSTLAHELGHSMHSYLTWQQQPQVYADYSLFLAEIASNFNQALVRAHLLEQHQDPEFQIAVIEEAMANIHRYFFIMPTLARFELELHERVERGEGLTAEGMNQLMAALFMEGYGEELVEDPARIGITWAQFGHLYMNFYVYQYATGIAGAQAFAERILAGESGAAAAYLGFLCAGSSDYPLDILREAGLDLASPEPVEKAFGVLARLVDRLESLVEARVTA